VAEATHWLVPAPGVPTVPERPGHREDPGRRRPGAGTGAGRRGHPGIDRPVTAFTVGAGELVVLGPRLVGGLSALTVSSSQPVAVEEDDGPSGAPAWSPPRDSPLRPVLRDRHSTPHSARRPGRIHAGHLPGDAGR